MRRLPSVGRAARLLLILATAAPGLALYLHIAIVQSEVNQDWGKVDQFAYMVLRQSKPTSQDYTYTGGRARMPLFPWIQALFYSPEMSDEAFFEQGKQINVLLISIAGIAAIGAAFFLNFSQIVRLLCHRGHRLPVLRH